MEISSLAASAALSLFSSISRGSASSVRSTASSTAAAENSAVTTISQAARDRLAAETRPAGSSAEYDTFQGSQTIDIDAYFTPDPSRSLEDTPLLAPSQRNIDALSRHVSAAMPDFLARHGIPEAPASISYDAYGQPQFPADYAYAKEFRAALDDEPVLARQMSTVAALTSHKVEMEKSLPFITEYQAAQSQAEIAAVLAKYRYLFDGTNPSSQIALNFDAQGRLTVSADGKPVAAA